MKSKNANTRKITIGTKEWADSNVNCYLGCSNNCRYCYAKKLAIRFDRKTEDTWKEMIPNEKNIEKNYAKRKGRIMFPTSHDITNESLNNCLHVLRKMLNAGNTLLITSKPCFSCIKTICDKFLKDIALIQFRFTITSINNNFLRFWEPNAPYFEERFESLKYAYEKGYKTSISIEPFLDKNPYILVDKLSPYVSESIWIGKMNYVQTKNLSQTEKKYYILIRQINTRENLFKIVEKSKLYNRNIIRIKDSVFNFLSQSY